MSKDVRQRRGHRRPHRTHRSLDVRSGADLTRRRAPIPTTRCAHGKRRYFSRTDAEFVLACLDPADPRRREKRSYECPTCHGWHLTSQTLEQYAAEQAARAHTRPPIVLDAPHTAGPIPSPALLAARAAERAKPVATPADSTPSRVREFARRVLRRLATITLR
ncbi:hypothetical protein ACFTS5_27455 [Nocardia sp. NPDC056952]|uniref:hypothetical protein n=1 Tax=Nocardia sp. NPDC056952 TaxID=3345979 RepID=UPI0036402925